MVASSARKKRSALAALDNTDNSNDTSSIKVSDYMAQWIEDQCSKYATQCETRIDFLQDLMETGIKDAEKSINAVVPKNPTTITEEDDNLNAPRTSWAILLKVTSGPYKGEEALMELTLNRPSVFVGRSRGRKFASPRGFSLAKDSEISSTHFEIKWNDDRVTLIDLQSTNGTTVNDQELLPFEPLELYQNTTYRVSVGNTKIELTLN